MIPEQRELWSKILAFDIDEGAAELTFAKRLARENGWAVAYAERVVEEYKRFVFLCFAAGHKCTPSDQVDQAWHLHIIYTESYWTRMCDEVLGRPLHHSPTKGGRTEGEKFADWYEKTKASYRELFGEEPPADIWPASDARFANAAAWRRVDTSQYWMLPKSRFKSALALGTAMAALGVVAVGCRDLLGEDAKIYEGFVVFLVVAAVLAIVIRFVVWWYTDGGDGGGSGCASSGCGGGGCGGGCGGGGCSS